MQILSKKLVSGILALTVVSCQGTEEDSATKVTRVNQTQVKMQSIGNCWLYAAASWLESMLMNDENEKVNVSESYWTYWHWFDELKRKSENMQELQTGGHWYTFVNIANEHGWVKEGEFLPNETEDVKSETQACALEHVNNVLKNEATLAGRNLSDETIKAVLNEAFSCNSDVDVNIDAIKDQYARSAADTMLRLPKTDDVKNMTEMLADYEEIYNNNAGNSPKKLPSTRNLAHMKKMEGAIKAALNDEVPVAIAFHVYFDAIKDDNHMFNLDTLAESVSRTGKFGNQGGHMILMHDYTASNVPGYDYLGEGPMDDEAKAAALAGDLDYIVAKNSWGTDKDRSDRAFIQDGYSRLTWDYLTKIHVDQNGRTWNMLSYVVVPSKYKALMD